MHLSISKNKHFGLKVLQTPKHLENKRSKLFKVEACSNAEVDDEGNKDSKRQSFLLWGF